MTNINLRPYQQAAIDSMLDYWAAGGGNALVDMATGLGKSVVVAKLTKDLLTQYPDMRILMLVHVRELVEQNAMALLRLWPDAPLGIYSAGLGRRDTRHPITFASIQSVYSKAAELGPRDLVLIDEAHLVPKNGDGMYRQLIKGLRELSPDMRVAGLTATPFRLDSGKLTDPVYGTKTNDITPPLFDKIVFSYGIRAGIEDGWLSPLISKGNVVQLDTSSVAKRGGEYIPGALEAAVDLDEITQQAVSEIAQFGGDRRSWLVFCTGVKHAHHVRDAIRALGFGCETITGETPGPERARFISEFKVGRLRALTNANVLTTGFDAPGVDLIAMLRPTLSTGLYVQMCGRGTRKADSKNNCLVLDFAGVVRRHGPVDTVEVESKGAGKKAGAVADGDVRAKECPTCHSLQPINTGVCRDCGHEWPVPKEKPKHEGQADGETPILSTDGLSRSAKRLLPDDHPVVSWMAYRHSKEGAPDSLKVTYLAGLMTFNEWVCFEHEGGPRTKAESWWRAHNGPTPVPGTVTEAMEAFPLLTRPDVIQTRKSGQWWEVVGRRFKQEDQHGEAA